MRKLLLDTHAHLWFVFDDPRLSEEAGTAIADPENELLLSVASLWEITIKRQLGKLSLGMELATFFRRFVEERTVTLVGLELPHLLRYDRLPLGDHRDPFDRLLVAQAQAEEAVVVTADPGFGAYEVTTLW